MKYESFDNDPNIVHFFKNILIYLHYNYIVESESIYTEFELFYNSISKLHNFEFRIVINILADNT